MVLPEPPLPKKVTNFVGQGGAFLSCNDEVAAIITDAGILGSFLCKNNGLFLGGKIGKGNSTNEEGFEREAIFWEEDKSK